MKNITYIDSLDLELFKGFKQIAIFVQSRNDMDTCCCALALAKLIEANIEGVTIGIYGYIGGSKFLRKQIQQYTNVKVNWEENVLAVFSEICGTNEIHKDNLALAKRAKKLLVIDHHAYDEDNKNHQALIETLSAIPTGVLHGLFSTSACEVLLDGIRKSEDQWQMSKEVAELMFMGLFTDTSDLTDAKPSTFANVYYLAEKYKIDPSTIIHKLKRRPVSHLRLFSQIVNEGWFSPNGKMMFLSVYTKQVRKYLPHHLDREKKGFKRKQMLTWIPRWAEEFADVNTIVFTHYSMFEPENPNRRIAYIILQKANPALEHVLKIEGFRQVENRWNREMAHADLEALMNKYPDLFTA